MTWQYTDLTRVSDSPPSAGDPAGYTDADMTRHVVYRGTDSHIHELSFNGAWRHTDLTSTAQGTPQNPAGDPVALTTGFGTTAEAHVVYRGTDNHIHELSFNGAWRHSDLTSTTQGNRPNPAGDPLTIYCPPVRDEPFVLYRGTDRRIHELSPDPDLTTTFDPPGPPKAAGGTTSAYYWAQVNGMNVAYRGIDGHVNLLSLHSHFGNQYEDITAAATGNPPAAIGNPVGTALRDKGEQHVVYRDGDGHLHDLVFDGQWHHNDLSDAGASPSAAGDPAVYAWDVDKTLHVLYRGTDNHIHEFCFTADQG